MGRLMRMDELRARAGARVVVVGTMDEGVDGEPYSVTTGPWPRRVGVVVVVTVPWPRGGELGADLVAVGP